MERLLARRQRLVRQLPPLENILRGSVVERSIGCGRASCHCADGDGHPVTYLSVTHAGGRTEQISLPATLVDSARQGVAVYQRWWEIVEQISAINRELLRLERQRGKRGALKPRGRGGG